MSEPIVRVQQGHLLGKIVKNASQDNFYSFQGIPYAKPPIGELRFKAPQPPESWSGLRYATKEGNNCYSRNMLFNNDRKQGSEDCLFLNVYTPQLPEASTALKPVMVWIHGGGFVCGSSRTDIYGTEFLLTEDIVLVTLNYRLGILGFLRFEDQSLGVSGNAGLKDMIMALRWVQHNISSFSGNPNNVTVFGESAGAAVVHYLVLSPLAKGLFHRAIAQSGSALNVFAKGSRSITQLLVSVLELGVEDERTIFEHLQKMSVEKLHEVSEQIFQLCKPHINYGSPRPFAPIVEDPSQDAFITEEPIEIIKSGNYNQVPLLFSYTTREGMLLEMMLKPSKPAIPQDFETIIPHSLGVEPGTEESKMVADKIKRFYYNEPGSEHKLENFYLLHTDNYFLRDILFATQLHAKTSQPVYLCQISIDTKLNLFKKVGNITAPGVAHGDDIGYLFKTVITPALEEGSLEATSVKRFVKLWTSFARSGNPNSHDLADAPEWKAVINDTIHFLDIGENLRDAVDPEPERMRFWRRIFNFEAL